MFNAEAQFTIFESEHSTYEVEVNCWLQLNAIQFK